MGIVTVVRRVTVCRHPVVRRVAARRHPVVRLVAADADAVIGAVSGSVRARREVRPGQRRRVIRATTARINRLSAVPAVRRYPSAGRPRAAGRGRRVVHPAAVVHRTSRPGRPTNELQQQKTLDRVARTLERKNQSACVNNNCRDWVRYGVLGFVVWTSVVRPSWAQIERKFRGLGWVG